MTPRLSSSSDGLDVPNCPTCLRPMEPIEAYGGVAMWSCGYGCD